jgi:hypothetical protein
MAARLVILLVAPQHHLQRQDLALILWQKNTKLAYHILTAPASRFFFVTPQQLAL